MVILSDENNVVSVGGLIVEFDNIDTSYKIHRLIKNGASVAIYDSVDYKLELKEFDYRDDTAYFNLREKKIVN